MHSSQAKRSPNLHSASGKKIDLTHPATAALRAASMLALLSALSLLAPRPAHAQTETVLYNFCSVQVSGLCTDGSSPTSNLTFRDGNYYGTTFFGGLGDMGFGGGTVFELSPNGSGGWNETVLYNLCSDGGFSCTDGVYPTGPLVFDSVGNLYGTTPEGGSTDCGLSTGCGIVFEISPVGAAWNQTVLYVFCPQVPCQYGLPGAAVVLDSAGNLYGTAGAGVFQLSPSGGAWTFKLTSFTNIGPINPYSGLVMDSSGNIFVLAPSFTAPGQQELFELSPNGKGWTPTILSSFGGPGGTWSGLVSDQAGNLYGESQPTDNTGTGTVYELSPGTSGWTRKTLFNFSYANSALDGFFPSGGLAVDASGNLYGTTRQGGANGLGTVFEVIPVGLGSYQEKVLWSFNGTDGSHPTGSPILDDAGNLYGTTSGGGSTGNGVVFEVTPAPTAASMASVTSSLNPAASNNIVTFTAIVASGSGTGSTPTGTVTFMDGATVMGTKALSNGTASFKSNPNINALPLGSNAITAVYHGDVNYSGSTSAPLTQIVKVPPQTYLISAPNPSAYGQTKNFSVTVTSSIGPPADGEILTFKEGSTVIGTSTLSGGASAFLYSGMSVGKHAVQADYGGDTDFKASISRVLISLNGEPGLTQVVDKAASTTALVSSQNPSIYGQSVTFTATVSPQFGGQPAGTVEFYNGTKELGTAALVDGVASFTTTKLAVGTGSITAKYFGNGSFLTSTSAALSQVVN